MVANSSLTHAGYIVVHQAFELWDVRTRL